MMVVQRISLRHVTFGILVIAIGIMSSDQIVYKHIIVPHLHTVQQVPVVWWLGMFFPILLCCFAVGAKSTSASELLLVSVGAATVDRIYGYIAAISHQPGHLKSYALEAPFMFWTFGLLGFGLMYAFLLWLGLIGNRLLDRRSK